MIKNYGSNVFDEGYNIIKNNYDTILEEDGEQQIKNMINHLKFEDEESLDSF